MRWCYALEGTDNYTAQDVVAYGLKQSTKVMHLAERNRQKDAAARINPARDASAENLEKARSNGPWVQWEGNKGVK